MSSDEDVMSVRADVSNSLCFLSVNKMLLLSRQRGGKRDPHVLHRQPSRSAPHRSHRVLRRPTLPLHLGDGKTVYGVSREVRTAGVVEGFLSRSVLLSWFGFSGRVCCGRALQQVSVGWRTGRGFLPVSVFLLLFTFSIVSSSAAIRRHAAAGGRGVQPASQRRE